MSSRWQRAMRYAFHRYLLRKRYLTADAARFGLRFRFRTEDDVGRHIYKRGVHEAALTRFVTEHVDYREGDVVFDVGANIGWYSLLLDRVLPEGAEVYAFEPDPANFALLQENLRLNAARRVIPVNRALAETTGTETLYRYAAKNQGRHSLLPVNAGERVTVRTTTLDDFAESRGLGDRVPRLIKIDVEGYEYFVLRGGEGVLRRCPAVLTEYAPGLMRRGGVEPRLLLELLDGHGFRPHLLGENGEVRAIPVDLLAGMAEGADVLWRKER